MLQVKTLAGLQLALRAGTASGLSVALAALLGLDYPIYAMIAAVIVTDLSPAESRRLGARRLAATVVGAICGAVLSALLPQSALSLGAGILAAMAASLALQSSGGVARVAGYICGVVLLTHSGDPWLYAALRFAETALGICVAWRVSHVPKLIELKAADDANT